jgi:hypothetical protein
VTKQKENHMSDYNPDPGRYGRYDYQDPDPGNGRAGYVLLAVLAAVALVGGFLYFGNPENRAPEQAQAPERTMNAPASPGGAPGTTNPITPAPTAPAQQTPAQPSPRPQE